MSLFASFFGSREKNNQFKSSKPRAIPRQHLAGRKLHLESLESREMLSVSPINPVDEQPSYESTIYTVAQPDVVTASAANEQIVALAISNSWGIVTAKRAESHSWNAEPFGGTSRSGSASFTLVHTGDSNTYVELNIVHKNGTSRNIYGSSYLTVNGTKYLLSDIVGSDRTGNGKIQISLEGQKPGNYDISWYVRTEWGDVTHSITVNPPVAPPVITTQPVSAAYSPNATTTELTVRATTNGYPGELFYQWQRSTNGTSWSNVTGQISSDLASSTYTPSTSTIGTYYYRCEVSNSRDGGTASTISQTATVVVAELPDDKYENNDTAATATELVVKPYTRFNESGLRCNDYDWYTFTIDSIGDAHSHVRINYNATHGNLELAIYSPVNLNAPITTRNASGQNEQKIGLEGFAPGTYYICVAPGTGGFNHTGTYELTIDPPKERHDTWDAAEHLHSPGSNSVTSVYEFMRGIYTSMADIGTGYYSFTVDNSGLVEVGVRTWGVQSPVIILYDSYMGTELARQEGPDRLSMLSSIDIYTRTTEGEETRETLGGYEEDYWEKYSGHTLGVGAEAGWSGKDGFNAKLNGKYEYSWGSSTGGSGGTQWENYLMEYANKETATSLHYDIDMPTYYFSFNATAGTTYYIYIEGEENHALQEAFWVNIAINPPAAMEPQAPIYIDEPVASSNSVVLQWGVDANADTYILDIKEDGGEWLTDCDYTLSQTAEGEGVVATVTGLKEGTKYHFVLTSVNAQGISAPLILSATTLGDAIISDKPTQTISATTNVASAMPGSTISLALSHAIINREQGNTDSPTGIGLYIEYDSRYVEFVDKTYCYDDGAGGSLVLFDDEETGCIFVTWNQGKDWGQSDDVFSLLTLEFAVKVDAPEGVAKFSIDVIEGTLNNAFVGIGPEDIAVMITQATLDIDGNGFVTTDDVNMLLYYISYAGRLTDSRIGHLIDPDGTRTTAADIQSYIEKNSLSHFDIDGNGYVTTDDVNMLLYYIAYSGRVTDSRIGHLIDPGGTRTTAAEIATFIESVWPSSAQASPMMALSIPELTGYGFSTATTSQQLPSANITEQHASAGLAQLVTAMTDDTVTTPGSTITLSLSHSIINREQDSTATATGIGLYIEYDPRYVEFAGKTYCYDDGAGGSLTLFDDEDTGCIFVAWNNMRGWVQEDDMFSLLTLDFTVKADAPEGIAVFTTEITNGSLNHAFSGIEPEDIFVAINHSVTPMPTIDFDGDRVVNDRDANLLLLYVYGNHVDNAQWANSLLRFSRGERNTSDAVLDYLNENITTFDLDGDGIVNDRDANLLLLYVYGNHVDNAQWANSLLRFSRGERNTGDKVLAYIDTLLPSTDTMSAVAEVTMTSGAVVAASLPDSGTGGTASAMNAVAHIDLVEGLDKLESAENDSTYFAASDDLESLFPEYETWAGDEAEDLSLWTDFEDDILLTDALDLVLSGK